MRKALGKLKRAFSDDHDSTAAASTMSGADDTFVHGHLSVVIKEARDVGGRSTGLLKKMERAIVSSMDGIDPYCTVKFGYNSYMRTHVVDNTTCPVWDAKGSFDVAHEADALEIRLKAAKRSGVLGMLSKVTHLSMLSIPSQELLEKRHIEGWLPLTPYHREITSDNPNDDNYSDSSSDEEKEAKEERLYNVGDLGEIHVDILFTPIAEWAARESSIQVGLANSYYPIRSGINVTMYQDSDCPPGNLPEIGFRPEYRHGRCWIDICNAIMEATDLIYITGWAVWPELKMVRTHHDGDRFQELTLGEMLKNKADDGVTVCVMVWDELASNIFYSGIMGTHDEEVIKYFKGSAVNAIKVSRQNDKKGPFADLNDSLMFTHHQKTVIVGRYDAEMGKSRIEAFVGGLDLTDGRYDNPTHTLFRSLQGQHAPPDFWQACALTVTAPAGPREPWHDIHCKVTGATAWDVLNNFEARWTRQAPSKLKEALHQPGPQVLLKDAEAETASGPWCSQLLRSINQSSAEIELDRPGLHCRHMALVDSSIHDAYVHLIRRAKSFIYFENQYFLGSSHVWDRSSKQRGGFSSHLIAIELAEKICAKIRAGQRFVAYLIVPMYPEGPPDSGAVQEILAHQRKTVNVITTRVKAAIDETGSDTQVSDWFSMFCLVNRESHEGGQGNGGTNEKEKLLAATRRFMIYVHSKFAVFDDEAALIGSANINARSMDGSRDSEIAALSWQPEHLAEGPTAFGDDVEGEVSTPQGDVAAFRASCWAEHLGGQYHDFFDDPASIATVRAIRVMAQENWEVFASEGEPRDLPYGHLALYPYQYDSSTGEVLDYDSLVYPDFPTAKINGSSSAALPNALTG